MFGILPNRLGPIFGLHDFVSVVLQHLAGAQPHERRVVDDKYLCHVDFLQSGYFIEVDAAVRRRVLLEYRLA